MIRLTGKRINKRECSSKQTQQFNWLLGILTVIALMTGCSSPSTQPVSGLANRGSYTGTDAKFVSMGNAERTYYLQVGDKLEVRFFYAPELTQGMVIRPDGKISLQLIGELQAAGLSPSQLQQVITEHYMTHLRQPEITVTVLEYTTPRIFVGGQVKSPGEQELRGRLSVLQAIYRSGGFMHDARESHVVLLRYAGDRNLLFIQLDLDKYLDQAEDQAGAYVFHCQGLIIESGVSTDQSCEQIQNQLAYTRDIMLEPHDVVFVPQTMIGSVADFFKHYVSVIVPIYANSQISGIFGLPNVGGTLR